MFPFCAPWRWPLPAPPCSVWPRPRPPPAADKQITFDNPVGGVYPRTRWSYSHIRETVPTANVWRGNQAPSKLPVALRNLDNLSFQSLQGETLSFDQMLERTYTDGILVLHKGQIVYERYFGALTPERPHIGMSLTKSFVGTLAATLAHEGVIDPNALVTKFSGNQAGYDIGGNISIMAHTATSSAIAPNSGVDVRQAFFTIGNQNIGTFNRAISAT